MAISIEGKLGLALGLLALGGAGAIAPTSALPLDLPKCGIVGAKKLTIENVTIDRIANGIFATVNEEINLSGITIRSDGSRTFQRAPSHITNEFIACLPKDKRIKVFSVPNDVEAMAFAKEIQQLLLENNLQVAKDITLTKPADKKVTGIIIGSLRSEYYVLVAHK